MADVLSAERQVPIISALAEVSGTRRNERMTGVHRDTINLPTPPSTQIALPFALLRVP
jgi:hypothetical protein